jgi:hypothetical protein
VPDVAIEDRPAAAAARRSTRRKRDLALEQVTAAGDDGAVRIDPLGRTFRISSTGVISSPVGPIGRPCRPSQSYPWFSDVSSIIVIRTSQGVYPGSSGYHVLLIRLRHRERKS